MSCRAPLGVAGVGVAGDVVAHGAAEELVDGLAVGLAGDVPEGLLDAGEGGEDGHAAAPEAVAVHALPEEVDAGRVLADDEALQVLDGGGDRALLHLQRAFAPAVDAPRPC